MKLRQNTLSSHFLLQGEIIVKRVFGDSMFPAIRNDTEVLITPIDTKEIRIGDVVYVQIPNQKVLIHRVFRFLTIKGERLVQTWGDNNIAPDPPVEENYILGRIVSQKCNNEWQTLKRGISVFVLHTLINTLHAKFLFDRLIHKSLFAMFSL